MKQKTIKLYVKSEMISTSSADLESLGHRCANPMRTGAYDRMGSESLVLSQEQGILMDAAVRVSEKMRWNLEIIDITKYGFMKKLRSREIVPRIECEGKILLGIPTSDEIIAYFTDFKENNEENLLKSISIDQREKMVEFS